MENVAFQPELSPAIPTVYGPKEYTEFRSTLEEMDRILVASGVEHAFILRQIFLTEKTKPTEKQYQKYRSALRYSILLDRLNKVASDGDAARDLLYRETALRMDNILSQLPQAVKNAHERIIGGRKVAGEDKILSLYEPDVHVLVRGKAGAEVEFGNGLYLAEQKLGSIAAEEQRRRRQLAS